MWLPGFCSHELLGDKKIQIDLERALIIVLMLKKIFGRILPFKY